MSYQVLARKYRPRGFDEVVGQDHVTTPLRNAIRSGRIPHAILLTGPRGTGKTTLARIFACCLNAEKGPTDAPDPDDPACLAIQGGHSTDVQEIDAASRTSVDDVREIIESIRYAAAPGKHRIFIVDEVHMLSTPAFNALLKTLEEPPPQSLFLFCTTNPEKIPFTVVSRCQRYDLRRIATAEVAANLGTIAKQEGLEISETSLLAVARAGDGSMRDSLTLLDQLIAFGGEKVDDARVAEVLDLIDRQVLVSIIEACVDGDASAALTTCRSAWESGVDAKRLGGELLGLVRDLVVLRLAPEAGLVEGADAEVAALTEIARRTEEARLRRMFRALLREQEDLAWAPDPFAVLEVALIRLATLPAGDQVEQLLARIDALEQRLRGGEGGGGTGGGGTPERESGGTRGGRPAGAKSSARKADARADSPAPVTTSVDPPAPTTTSVDPPAPTMTSVTPPASESEPWETTAVETPSASAPPTQTTGAPAAEAPDDEPAWTRAGEPAPVLQVAAEDASPPGAADLAALEPSGTEADRAGPDTTHPGESAPLPLVFDRLRAFAQDANRGLFAALEGGELLEHGRSALRIRVPSGIAARRLATRSEELEGICGRFFGRPMRVELQSDDDDPKAANGSSADAAATADAKRQRQEALNHPAVNDALEILGAEILEIRPYGADPATPEAS